MRIWTWQGFSTIIIFRSSFICALQWEKYSSSFIKVVGEQLGLSWRHQKNIWKYKEDSGPVHTGGIWNRSFMSSVRSTAHTNPSRETQLRRKRRFSNHKNLKTPALCFSLKERKHSKNGGCDTHDIFLPEFSWNTKPKLNDRWLLRFQISPFYCGRKIFERFQSEIFVLKFLW